MANRRFIDFPIASTSGDTDIILIWQGGANKQTTKATFLSGLPENLDELNDVAISGLTNGQILRYDSVTGKWENTDQGNLDLNDLNDVSIVSPSNGQVLVYNSSTSKWENSSGGYVPYTGAVTTVNLGAQTIQAGQFVKAGGTSSQFLKADGSIDSNTYGTGTVTSVALTMPSAFNVANSPITTAGTLAVTGAGTVGQYIRGDGSLADFPQASGGGSSVNYYLNGSISQGTIGGVAYKELNKVPILGAGTDFTINADGYIASFLTDAGDPNLLEIPGGNWNFETYFSASSSGGSPSFYVELYKYDGTTFTLIASSSSSPELIAFGTNLNPYFSTLAVPTTTLALTDRLAVRYYVTHSGRTITLHTENNHLCQVVTTFTTGLTSLNGLTAQVQNLAVGTSGTDFNIASATATHTFNLPTASATNRGALSSADWSTFNSKQNALTNPVTGTGAAGQIAYFTGTSAITSESGLTWDATNNNLSIGGATANSNLTVSGNDNTNIFTVLSGANSRLHIGTVTSPNNDVYIRSQNNYALNLGVNNTNYLTILSSGNLGVNTATPTTAFEVNGVGLFTGGSLVGNTKNGVYIYDTVIASLAGGNARSLQIQAQTLSIFTGTTYSEKFKIFENGNVVISTSPSDNGAKLQVSGTSSFTGNVSIGTINSTERLEILGPDGSGAAVRWRMAGGRKSGYLYSDSAGVGIYDTNLNDAGIYLAGNIQMDFRVNGSQRMFINSSGNVGIGTASPAGLLEINGLTFVNNTGDSTARLLLRNSTTGANAGGLDIREIGVDASLNNASNGYLSMSTNNTERMRITSGGNVLIGTTTDNGARLQVSGNITSSTGVYDTTSATNHWFARVQGNNRIITDATGYVYMPFLTSGSGIDDLGWWGSSGGSWTYNGMLMRISSSARYKKNIRDLEIDSSKIYELKTISYENNENTGVDGLTSFGLLAEDVAEKIPLLATFNNDNQPEGVQYKMLSVLLLNELKKLKQEIETLKS